MDWTRPSPFIFDGPLPPEQVIGRNEEADTLRDWARRGRFMALVAPRRFGKTSLIGKVQADAEVGRGVKPGVEQGSVPRHLGPQAGHDRLRVDVSSASRGDQPATLLADRRLLGAVVKDEQTWPRHRRVSIGDRVGEEVS